MSLVFEPSEGVILVPTRLQGPTRSLVALLVLDTGAEGTVVKADFISALGFDLSAAPDAVELTTAGGIVRAPRVRLERIEVLGHARPNFGVTAYTTPPRPGVDGILGMDFFLGRKLTIDFRIGLVTLE